ncbi:MAG: B12-binding domain-containing radical SAM protein [Planctomycetes bacterium]|nr:B12-binding domain-containing radical SAM protein [Planctomycetota bacterium]
MSDVTLVNLNMLYVRYASRVDRERHVPLGPLYLVRALTDAGFDVDFRDYQLAESEDPFAIASLLDFLADPAPVIGISVMANLLPFAVLAIREIRERWPDRRVLLGGVGPKAVERRLGEMFPWLDVIVRGEGERTFPRLLAALRDGADLRTVSGLTFREDGAVVSTPAAERIEDLDAIPFPAFDRVDLSAYDGYGMVTSRGCPYPCTFCSVAPVWDHISKVRSPENVIAEMRLLHEKAGVDLFLFQDEFFVSSPARVQAFCRELRASGLKVRFKAFGRVNLTDEATMQALREAGCVEIRYGIESGSDRILELTKKGFTAAQAVDVVAKAVRVFPRVDAFYIWGFPFETMEDFHQTVFQMLAVRALGARVLPSLLCLLPQTELYESLPDKGKLQFCRELFPEYMLTGHEVVRGGGVTVRPEHRPIFDFIEAHPDLFPGFFHVDVEGNVRPKLRLLQELGFYPREEEGPTDSCGAHSPRLG